MRDMAAWSVARAIQRGNLRKPEFYEQYMDTEEGQEFKEDVEWWLNELQREAETVLESK